MDAAAFTIRACVLANAATIHGKVRIICHIHTSAAAIGFIIGDCTIIHDKFTAAVDKDTAAAVGIA